MSIYVTLSVHLTSCMHTSVEVWLYPQHRRRTTPFLINQPEDSLLGSPPCSFSPLCIACVCVCVSVCNNSATSAFELFGQENPQLAAYNNKPTLVIVRELAWEHVLCLCVHMLGWKWQCILEEEMWNKVHIRCVFHQATSHYHDRSLRGWFGLEAPTKIKRMWIWHLCKCQIDFPKIINIVCVKTH